MSQFIQSLEARTLFAAVSSPLTADLAMLNADAKAVRGQLTLLRSTVLNNVKTIQSDLKGLSNKSNAKRRATLKADDAKSLAAVTFAQASYLASVQGLARKTTADGRALSAHPSNARLSARVAADVNNLNSAVSAKSSALRSAVSSLDGKFNDDVILISSANNGATPLSTDVTNAETGLARNAGNYLVFASSFATDAGVLATDAGAIGSGT
jgi:hypothetical protein